MFTKYKNHNKPPNNFSFPPTKLRNITCLQCKNQFLLREFRPINGIVPLLLKCGHVVCDKCANAFQNKPCPLCNTITQSDNEKTFTLPLNLYTLGLLLMSHNRPVDIDDCDVSSFSKATNSKLKQQSMKGLCNECGIQAAIKCPQCAALYCNICYSKIHGRALQSHSKVMLSEDSDTNAFSIKNTCSGSCEEPLGYFCSDCNNYGCSHCMLLLHQRHNYQPLQKKNEELLGEYINVYNNVSENLQRIQLAQKKLKTTVLKPVDTHEIDNVEVAVTQHFTRLHGVLQNMEKELVDSLRKHRDSRNKNIDELCIQLKESEEQLQSALVVVRSVTDNLDKVNLQEVINKLQKLCEVPCHLVHNSVPVLDQQKVEFDVDESICQAIRKHCSIRIPKTPCFTVEKTNSLPDDYEIEPLVKENLNSSRLSERSGKSVASSSNVSKPTDYILRSGSSEMVRVSHVVDPYNFYVQLMPNQRRISDLNKTLATLAKTSSIPSEAILHGMCIVNYVKGKAWYRGRVEEKRAKLENDEGYTIMYVDYGMKEENVPLHRMRNIPPKYSIIPPFAVKCTLYDIVPDGGKWHANAINAFKGLCENASVSILVHNITGDTYYVDLMSMSSKDSGLTSVKDTLTYMKYGTCVTQNSLMRTNPESVKFQQMPTYFREQLELNCYVEVQVLFVENPYAIYIQKLHGSRTHLTKLISDMTEDYNQNSTSYRMTSMPCKGSPCAVQGVDGLWYRGQIREIIKAKLIIFYVDLGYILEKEYDQVKVLSRKYMGCRTQAIKVTLKNIKPPGNNENWDHDTIAYARKLFMTKYFKVIAFEEVGDSYIVSMFSFEDRTNIVNALIENNLAVSTNHGSRGQLNTKNKNKNFNNNNNNKRNKQKMNMSFRLNVSEERDEPMNLSMKNKSIDENDDPFKIAVLVHHVLSPDCIYVSDASGDTADVENMMQKMQEFYGKYTSPQPDVWEENAICAVYSANSEMYYRGRIDKIIGTDKVTVFLFDLGIEETVSFADIQALYPSFSTMKTFVFKIRLTGILPCGGSNVWPSLSCQKLCEIINNNKNCKFYISKLDEDDTDEGALPVELWIRQIKLDGPLAPTRHEINSINRMLVEYGLALPIKEYAKKRDKILAIELKRQLTRKIEKLSKIDSNGTWYEINNGLKALNCVDAYIEGVENSLNYSQPGKPCEHNFEHLVLNNIPSVPKLSSWLPPKLIEEDTFVAVPTYLDHEGYVYLHSIHENSKILEYIENKLEELYHECPVESCDTVWTPGDLCIAQYHMNKKWYRGTVVKIHDVDSFDVQFVDYGNTEECSIGTLKKKVILEDIPIQCTKCVIHGLVPKSRKWMTEDLDKIHNLIIDNECEVTVIDKTNADLLVVSLTMSRNKFCKKKCDLIEFLVDKWKMKLVSLEDSVSDNTMSEINVSEAQTMNETVENCRSFSLDESIVKDTIVSGNSLTRGKSVIKAERRISVDIESFSLKEELVASTPYVGSEENLSSNYKILTIPTGVDYVEIELCVGITPTKFYAQLKNNAHSPALNTYYRQYEKLMEDLQKEAWKQPIVSTLAVDTLCCAKFTDGLWYRCIITESEPTTGDPDKSTIQLLYVDFGNAESRTVHFQQCELHTLKTEWINIPAMLIKGKLSNIKVNPTANYETLVNRLQNMYNRRVIALVKGFDDDFTFVELYKNKDLKELLYNELIEEGLFEVLPNKN